MTVHGKPKLLRDDATGIIQTQDSHQISSEVSDSHSSPPFPNTPEFAPQTKSLCNANRQAGKPPPVEIDPDQKSGRCQENKLQAKVGLAERKKAFARKEVFESDVRFGDDGLIASDGWPEGHYTGNGSDGIPPLLVPFRRGLFRQR